MVLEMDNKGSVDLANNLNIGSQTQHMDLPDSLLRELKDQDYWWVDMCLGMKMKWIFLQKYYGGCVKKTRKFVRNDEYMVEE